MEPQARSSMHEIDRDLQRLGAVTSIGATLRRHVRQAGRPGPSCYLSYAWGDPAHEGWVVELAEDLVAAGIGVILDRWENARVGASVVRFVDRVLAADTVVVVGTRAYTAKYLNDESMRGYIVAAEADLIGLRLLGPEAHKASVFPVLLEGEPAESLPPLLRGRVFADFRDPRRYARTLVDLMLDLYGFDRRDPASRDLRRHLLTDLAG